MQRQPPSARSPNRTAERKAAFLEGIHRGMTVQDAADYAQVHRTTPYVWEKRDQQFAETWRNIKTHRLQQLVDTAYDLALKGDVRLIKWLITRYEATTHQLQPQETTIRIIRPNGDTGHDFIELRTPEDQG